MCVQGCSSLRHKHGFEFRQLIWPMFQTFFKQAATGRSAGVSPDLQTLFILSLAYMVFFFFLLMFGCKSYVCLWELILSPLISIYTYIMDTIFLCAHYIYIVAMI